jgi:glycosyltransferase involved in cell wall biosynthesis
MPDKDGKIQVLFIGLGASRVAWYRVVLPAMFLGLDWMGVVGEPPHLQFVTGYVGGGTKAPNFDDYDIIVVEQARGRKWFDFIQTLRERGKVVLYEIDDYVDGIRKSQDHDFRQYFQREHLKQMHMCMRACDGLIASTDYIARRYKSLVPRTYLCLNGLDMGRYRMSMPPRGDIDGKETVTLMWSGATGHIRGVEPWLEVVRRSLDKYPHLCFASVGQNFAAPFADEFPNRTISIPFAALETYPAAMMLGDIALAPAGKSSWYAGKSTLRAMEAAALGLPVIADTHYAGAINEGETGYVVESPGQVLAHIERLVEDAPLRRRMGAAARHLADTEFNMSVRRQQWEAALLNAYSYRNA